MTGKLCARVAATAKRETKSGKCTKNAERIARRAPWALRTRHASFRLGRATSAAALRTSRSITCHFDLQETLQIRDALVELITHVDVLSIAEKGAIGFLARCFAAAGEF